MPHIASPFSLKSSSPNFKRDQFTTYAEMVAVSPTDVDEGHICYCIETERRYEFLAGTWVEYDPETSADKVSFEETDGGEESDVETALRESLFAAKGEYGADASSLDLTAFLPVNGKNYALGSISQLTFADSLAPMTLGSTIQFTASADFSIGVPTDANAATKSRIITDTSLDCTSGSEYVLFLSAVSTDPTDSAFSNPSYINLFSLVELNAPS